MTEQRNQTWAQSQASTLNQGSGFLVEAVVRSCGCGRGAWHRAVGHQNTSGLGKKSRADQLSRCCLKMMQKVDSQVCNVAAGVGLGLHQVCRCSLWASLEASWASVRQDLKGQQQQLSALRSV